MKSVFALMQPLSPIRQSSNNSSSFFRSTSFSMSQDVENTAKLFKLLMDNKKDLLAMERRLDDAESRRKEMH